MAITSKEENTYKCLSEHSFHELFSDPEADVVLCSNDGTYFRIPSITLRTASGFFRSTLSLPQPATNSASSDIAQILPLDEPAALLVKLLLIMSGLGLSPADMASLDDITMLAFAAEKYEVPGVVAFARGCMLSLRFVHEPARLYAFACRMGWTDEVKHTMPLTLGMDLYAPVLQPIIATLSSTDLMRLFKLRFKRLTLLRRAFEEQAFPVHDYRTCKSCYEPLVTDPLIWREWKLLVLDQFEKDLSGASVVGGPFMMSKPMNTAFTTRWCRNAKCSKPQRIDRFETLKELQSVIEAMPTSI